MERGFGGVGSLGRGIERRDQRLVTALGKFLARLDGIDHVGNAVDDGEHGGDQRAVRLAAAGAAIGQRVLGGVGQ